MIGNIFSNRWKTGEKFFQSLEKWGGIFQPLENFFPIIGKTGGGRGASRLCRGEGVFVERMGVFGCVG
jgi:hypothetical protein